MGAVPVIVGAMATWRLTHLVVAEDGPWNVVAHLRRAAGAGVVGQMMDCFDCASVWMALPFALWLGHDWTSGTVAWLALSGAAIVIERFTPAAPSSSGDDMGAAR